MKQPVAPESFIDTLPVFREFGNVADIGNYQPLPPGWALALADIVDSTGAVAAGHYKSVNMAGASVISALLNALDRRDLPFVFGGDGAQVVVPPSAISVARDTLAAVQTWVAEELDMTMRAALVPVEDIRAEGLDVLIARFQPSADVSYAMFAGGGGSWAEARMKAGRYRIEPAQAGTRPDLTGLSCRWNPIDATLGEIVSIIAVPGPAHDAHAFQDLVSDLISLTGQQQRGGHPLPAEGPEFGVSSQGLDAEARANAPAGRRWISKLWISALMFSTIVADKLGWKIGGFDPRAYRREVARNSDFRKFDDGLKMTIDVGPAVLRQIEDRLQEAERAGICNYGLHRQNSALMTCIVASPMQRDHVHFIDGAMGGYAVAMTNLKAKLT
ncbi:adenylate cyclase [Paramesorhizobium deserti]|uniref:Adenylate cyclase n=1 Tax=Paramesorhizobium deserti TaxID=1494590 RepID=A0A135HNX6_9HYPH|nr:DUF3095 domain-containing protein [Paramesorhizobium deserti]KXF74922.1 adenylate cyclase [Paramesorhizobium deserti]